ncbi:hypothetical protein K6L09_46570, partial [Burkholderia cepacia]
MKRRADVVSAGGGKGNGSPARRLAGKSHQRHTTRRRLSVASGDSARQRARFAARGRFPVGPRRVAAPANIVMSCSRQF